MGSGSSSRLSCSFESSANQLRPCVVASRLHCGSLANVRLQPSERAVLFLDFTIGLAVTMTDSAQAPPVALPVARIGSTIPRNHKKASRRRSNAGTFSRATRDELTSARPDNPGPGSYSEHETFVWQHDSISKKGYTAGFASQAPRLGNAIKYTGPGPGAVLHMLKSQCSIIVSAASL